MNRKFFLPKIEHTFYDNLVTNSMKGGTSMLRGQKVSFRASKTDLKRLYACNRESVLVWNECLRLAKE
ncbi:MAG TPA: hypothetical protein VEY68_02435 [Anoxybacillus sp.]|nr:hypothetical protein [Anoxybacillus sp.]